VCEPVSTTEHILTAAFSIACFTLFLYDYYFDQAPVLVSMVGGTAVTTFATIPLYLLHRARAQRRHLALASSLYQLTPAQFEQAVAELFRADGYHARTTGGANDRGIDIYLEKEGQRAVVPCKRYRQKVTPSHIRDFIGAMNGAGVEIGYFGQPAAIPGQRGKLKPWLVNVLNSGIEAFVSFAKGIVKDFEAVENALSMPWSNGQTEGQVNRLKFIKRQMYGRANFDLLRRRVLGYQSIVAPAFT
jgi:hypothetical protein